MNSKAKKQQYKRIQVIKMKQAPKNERYQIEEKKSNQKSSRLAN
jgi:hypothetical protein